MGRAKDLKVLLEGFWMKAQQAQEPEQRLALLREYADFTLIKMKKKRRERYRYQFRFGLDAWRKSLTTENAPACFVCWKIAEFRHHIVMLHHGGDNRKQNIVGVCGKDHELIHPWLREARAVEKRQPKILPKAQRPKPDLRARLVHKWTPS